MLQLDYQPPVSAAGAPVHCGAGGHSPDVLRSVVEYRLLRSTVSVSAETLMTCS